MAAQPENPESFGALICERRSRVDPWIGSVLFAGASVFLALFTLAAALDPSPALRWGSLLGLALTILTTRAALRRAHRALTTVRFYELAAERRTLGRTVAIPYVEATSLTYFHVQKNHHGRRIGLRIYIRITADPKRVIFFYGMHKTQALILGTIDTVDELDILRDRISAIIADHLAERLLSREPVAWGPLAMTSAGLIPRRGKYKGQVIPYSQVDRQAAASGKFFLYRRGDKRRFVSISVKAANFWPCLVLFRRMQSAEAVPAELAHASPA